MCSSMILFINLKKTRQFVLQFSFRYFKFKPLIFQNEIKNKLAYISPYDKNIINYSVPIILFSYWEVT